MHAHRSLPLAILLVVPAADAAAQATFARSAVASTDGARGIATADFDRNGWPDVAHANGSRRSVTILLNSGGTLARGRDIPVGQGPFDLVAADFNRDGIQDLAATNADDDSVSILLGEGDGTFRQVVLRATRNPRGITAADMNGDGRVDLVYSGYLDNSVNVVFATASGGLAGGFKFRLAGTRPQGLAATDFNHDGLMDVAVAHEDATALSVLYGHTGPQRFTQVLLRTPAPMNVLATGDFNRDGWEDIAAASSWGNRVAVYLGSRTGHRYSRAFATARSPRDIAVADLDRDGALDVVTANRDSDSVSVLLGSGDASLFAPAFELAAGNGSRAAVLADFDIDGLVDVGVANQFTASFTVLSNTTAFSPAALSFNRQTFGSSPHSWAGQGFYVRDFDRDGRLDVAVASADPSGSPSGVSILLGGERSVSLAGNAQQRVFWAGHANADGHLDIVLFSGFSPSRVVTYLGDGRGGFTRVDGGGELPSNPRGFELADVTGDGVDDLVFGVYTGMPGAYALHVVPGTGDGTFGTARVTPIATPLVLAGVADVTRDGRPDALVRRLSTQELQVWAGDGTGQFTEGARTLVPELDGFWIARAGDVDHNGYPDVVIVGGNNAGTLLNGPAGLAWNGTMLTLQETEFLSDGKLADLNVDGHLDVVFAPTFVAFGNGDGTFRAERFAHGLGGFDVADITADGLPDLVHGVEGGGVDVLVNTRRTTNRNPTVDAGADFSLSYQEQFVEEGYWHFARAEDPDAHGVTYEWRDDNGALLSTVEYVVLLPPRAPGRYRLTVTVNDGRGGTASNDVILTIEPLKEIVLHAGTGGVHGWSLVDDSTAARGFRVYDPNAGAPKVQAPLADPARYLIVDFIADPTRDYKLWVRLKADRNSWANDSIWVQFTGAVGQNGRTYAPGTTSGLPVNLEECGNCGVSGWGWEDDGWGARDENGVLLRFPEGGRQFLVIQRREDGVSVDQVVLSSEKYVTQRPGAAKNDTTILTITQLPE